MPQRTVLGPFLYTIYTADLPQNVNVISALFADDTTILTPDYTLTSQKLPKAISKIEYNRTVKKGDCPPITINCTLVKPPRPCKIPRHASGPKKILKRTFRVRVSPYV